MKKKKSVDHSNSIKAALQAAFIIESQIVDATPEYVLSLTHDCIKYRAREYNFKSPWVAYCLFMERLLTEGFGFRFDQIRSIFLSKHNDERGVGSRHDIPHYMSWKPRVKLYADYLENQLVQRILTVGVTPSYELDSYLSVFEGRIQKCQPYMNKKYRKARYDLDRRYSLYERQNEERKKSSRQESLTQSELISKDAPYEVDECTGSESEKVLEKRAVTQHGLQFESSTANAHVLPGISKSNKNNVAVEVIPEGVSGLKHTRDLLAVYPQLEWKVAELLINSVTTQPEMLVLEEVTKELQAINYEGFIEIGTIGVIVKHYQNGKTRFTVRKFDILLPDLGIAIEVDGSSHWKYVKKMRSDATRDDDYIALGLIVPQIVDNGDACIPLRRVRNAKELARLVQEELLKENIEGTEKRTIIETNLARGRNELYLQFPGLERYFKNLASSYQEAKPNTWQPYHFGQRMLMTADRKRGRPSRINASELVKRARRYILQSALDGKKPNQQEFSEMVGCSDKTVRVILLANRSPWNDLVKELTKAATASE